MAAPDVINPPPPAAPPRSRLKAWGALSEPYPLASAKEAQLLSTKILYGALQELYAGDVLHGVLAPLTTNGVTLTSVYSALFDTSGNLLTAAPQNQNTVLESGAGQVVQLPFFASGTYEVTTTGAYYAALLVISTGTLPTLQRMLNTAEVQAIKGNASSKPLFVKQEGQTGVPEKATFVGQVNSVWLGTY